MFITVKQAKNQAVIQRHWQRAWKRYQWSADGCGDNLYKDAISATYAYSMHETLGLVLTQKQIEAEWRAEGAIIRAEVGQG